MEGRMCSVSIFLALFLFSGLNKYHCLGPLKSNASPEPAPTQAPASLPPVPDYNHVLPAISATPPDPPTASIQFQKIWVSPGELSAGQKAGIVIGVLAGAGALCVAGLWTTACIFSQNLAALAISNRGQNAIQQLLAAEQEAQRIVIEARKAKLARLKQAKEEAEKEIAEFRAHMELEVVESYGDSDAIVKRLEQETEAKIHHLKTQAARISNDVVQMLLNHVTTVKK
ncbi:uncharacterized protein LOC108997048 [Juglans regia]|uniref:Uncharacterized protein LOC108997048 n=1 Tax=Juglans regia TaxID=51240 RepID=A0A6P9EY43_JUGRE|nr:uncharacterized protein LOC108997048 [Juglans regia]